MLPTPEPELEAYRRASRRGALLSLAGTLIVVASLLYSYYKLQQLEQATSLKRAEIGRLQAQADSLRTHNGQLRQAIASSRTELAQLSPIAARGFGMADSLAAKPANVARSLQANQRINQLARQLPTQPTRTEVYYFARDRKVDVNQELFIKSLTDLGFSVQVRSPKSNSHNATASNGVWYGSQTDARKVRLVALSMVRAGYKVRQVAPIFEGDKKGKQQRIEIGGNLNVRNNPPYSIQRIEQLVIR